MGLRVISQWRECSPAASHPGAESQAVPSPEDAEGGAHLLSASSALQAVAEQFALRPVVSVLPNPVN